MSTIKIEIYVEVILDLSNIIDSLDKYLNGDDIKVFIYTW